MPASEVNKENNKGGISIVPIPIDKTDRLAIINVLEKALMMAHRGEVISLSLFMERSDGLIHTMSSGCEDRHATAGKLMEAAINRLAIHTD
jgi:hypothetical protein